MSEMQIARVQPAGELTPSITTAAGVHALQQCGYWFCGRCGSVIPVTFWHDCDDKHAHSAPYDNHR